MIELGSLEPGDLIAVEPLGKRFIYIGMLDKHPIWPQFSMLIMREIVAARDLSEAKASDHRLGWVRRGWHHDALVKKTLVRHAYILTHSDEERQENLVFALLDGGIGNAG